MPKPPKGNEVAVQKGLQLLREARERGEKLSYQKAAIRAGCHKTTLNFQDRGVRESLPTVNN